MKRNRFDFCVNVKEFWCLHVTREKAQYFNVIQFSEEYRGPSLMGQKNSGKTYSEYIVVIKAVF